MPLCSKTDAMAVLYELRNGGWAEVARTEMIANNQGAHALRVVHYTR